MAGTTEPEPANKRRYIVITHPIDTSTPKLSLDIGYGGTPSFTCSYTPDPLDSTNLHFLLASCTNGMQAGDLVGASWA
jgi:hypothetical protein